MIALLITLLVVYFSMMIAQEIYFFTRRNVNAGKFLRAKGLWILVPFRLGGWLSVDGHSIFKKDWVFVDVDYGNKLN